MRFLSIGECMAELAPAKAVGEFRLGFAGDTFNTAWYLRRLRDDVQVSYFTAVGTDPLSDQMLGFIADAGIGTGGIRRVEGATVGLYLISLQDGERSFSYWRDTSAARRLTDDAQALAAAVADADQIYFSGITLAILNAEARATLLNALRGARTAGKSVVFDPNLRPRLWTSGTEMTETTMQGAAVSTIVLPSFEDEASHFDDIDPEATARRYAQAGAVTVVVKNGDDAVHFLHGGGSGRVEVPAVSNVVDTTAAGDSFNAGFLAARHAGVSVPDCIALGARVAGEVIRGKGALVVPDIKAAV